MDKGVPAGVRLASALLWLGAACGAFLVVAGLVADHHVVSVTPSLAPYTAVVGQDPSYLVSTVRDALWLQIPFSAVVGLGCGITAWWVGQPSGNARGVSIGAVVVLIPVMGILLGGSAKVEADTLADATGNPGLEAAYHHLFPSWLGLSTQVAEISIIVVLAVGLLLVVLGRHSEYYQRGRVEATATFWATDKLNNG
jgi:hypothetical protein